MTAGRVLLVNPRITSRQRARFPLSMLTIAAALEGKYASRILDGNVEVDGVAAVDRALSEEKFDAVGVSVMGGPQVHTAIEISRAVKERAPRTPVVWGGYFPTLYPDAAMNASYVDYAVRGQAEDTLPELLGKLTQGSADDLNAVAGLSWRQQGVAVHNAARRFSPAFSAERLPYEKLGDPRKYLVSSFLGQRTAAHQAALGCRFRCTFCGVAAMFRGATALPPAERLQRDLRYLKHELGVDSIQFCDHNFFDREVDMVPLLEVLAQEQLPWWCYARADALINLSAESWALVRRSRLRMAYIGAESPSDALLHDIRKGTRSDQTLAVTELCRAHGVIPELSFMVAPPHDPEGETERTFEFVRQLKRINPHAEIIIYIYTPLPSGAGKSHAPLLDAAGAPIQFPRTPEEWTQRRWVDYACHADAPWLSERLRRRIRDFVTVLGCRFPTVQDVRYPRWSKVALSALAAWRYRYRKYDRPWELNLSKSLIRLSDPRVSSL
jgi:anaerobic magnesium-protoporphyrin IX monomethyl ester cyclase